MLNRIIPNLILNLLLLAWLAPSAQATTSSTNASTAPSEAEAAKMPTKESTEASEKTSASLTEIKVTLFGQPCFLTGPLDEATLKAIHAVSPEKISSLQSSEQAKLVLDRVHNSQLPAAFDVYKKKAEKYLQSRVAFFDGLSAARKANKLEPLFKSISSFLSEKRAKDFEATVKRIEPRDRISSWNSDVFEQLQEALNEALEQQPEEEYHRSVKKLNVRYTCAFGETE